MAPNFRNLWSVLPWRRDAGISTDLAVTSPVPATTSTVLQHAPPQANVPQGMGATNGNGNGQATRVGPARVVRPITEVEFGVSGTENFGGYIKGEDYNPDLDNFQTAIKIYDKMRLGDAQIKAMLSVLKLPLRGAKWRCMPGEDGDSVDQGIADFCNKCIFDDDAMETSWDFVLRHILLQLDFGFSTLELVWDVDETGAYKLQRLAPRLPKTIREWHVDRFGHLKAVVQYAPVPTSTMRTQQGYSVSRPGIAISPTQYQTSVSYQYLTIPAEYLALFTLEREGDAYEGRSILRTVYRNWIYKDRAYELEGVRLDRWGVGIPVAKLEEGHDLTQNDLDDLATVLKSVRANQRAFLIAPPKVSYELMPESGGTTAGTGAKEWIEHHDQQIARNVLAGFLTMGSDPHGTLGFGSRLTDMFVSSLNGIAAGISADLKHQVVRKLCDLNFDMTKRKYPRVTCQDLEQVDMEQLIETLAVLQGTWIQPDDDTEKMLRKLLQLPPLQPEMSRENKADAMPGTDAMAQAAAQQQQRAQGGPPVDPNNPNASYANEARKAATAGTNPDGTPVESNPKANSPDPAKPDAPAPHVNHDVVGVPAQAPPSTGKL